MHRFLAFSHSPHAFDFEAALSARHAQHPVIVHFPIALFFASAFFEVLAIWRKQPIFASVAYYNLLGAALTVPLALVSGLGAWRWQLEGAVLKGNLELHLISALASASLILILWWMRYRLRVHSSSPGMVYMAVTVCALMAITLTGHLGGIVSGVEMP